LFKNLTFHKTVVTSSFIALDTEINVKALRKLKDNLDPIAVGQPFAVLWFPGLSLDASYLSRIFPTFQ